MASCPDGRESLYAGKSCNSNEDNGEHRTTSCRDCQVRNDYLRRLSAEIGVI